MLVPALNRRIPGGRHARSLISDQVTIEGSLSATLADAMLSAQGSVIKMLLDANWHTPPTQERPTTAAALETLMGNSGQASHIWLGDEASGAVADRVGSVDLSPNGNVEAWQYDRILSAWWDGSGFYRGIEQADNDSRWNASSSASLDFDASTSFAILLDFRALDNCDAIAKTDGVGYFMKIGDSLDVFLNDGTTQIQLRAAGISANAGNRIPALLVVNRTTQTAHLYTEANSDSEDISSLGSLANSDVFSLGARGSAVAGRVQYFYAAAWEDAAAEGLGQSHLDNFAQAFKDPSGALTTYARASQFSDIVGQVGGEDVVAHYSGEPSTPHVALGWHSALTLGEGFGLRTAPVITNEIFESENFSEWNEASSATITDDDEDAPDGFRSAGSFAPGGTSSFGWETGPVSESTQYTVSAWLRADTPHDCKIEATDAGGSNSAIANGVFSVTAKWKRYSFTFTSEAGQTGTRVKIFPDHVNGTDAIDVWGVQINEGDVALPYVRTAGGAASTAAIDARAAGDYVREEKGEVEATFLSEFDGGQVEKVFGTEPDSDRRNLFLHNGDVSCDVRTSVDGVLGLNDGAYTEGSEHRVHLQWNSDGDVLGSGNSVRVVLDGSGSSESSAFTSGGGFTNHLGVGQSGQGNDQLYGLISRLRTYNQPKTEAA